MGRPTEYTADLGDRILALMEGGLSLAAAAAECDIHRQRVYDWAEKHEDFADTVKLAMAKRQAFLERRLLEAKEGPVVTSSIFALKNAAAKDWRDVVRQEHTGAEGGAIKTETVGLDSVVSKLIAATGASETDALRALAATPVETLQ